MEFSRCTLSYYENAVVLILATIGIGYLGGTVAYNGKVGVAIGQLGDNLPPPSATVALLLKYNIQRVRIYDTNASLLSALAGSGIEVTVQVPNEDVGAMANNLVVGHDIDGNEIRFAEKWISDNISPHVQSCTTITAILVGNEWLGNANADYNASWLVPALYNIHAALQTAGLNITVSTPHRFSILNNSFPPSEGTFDPKYHSVLRGVLGFLLEKQSDPTFDINIFPYFAYRDNPSVSLAYATFQSSEPVTTDPNTRLPYFNLLDAQLDAVYFAIDALLSTTSSSQLLQPLTSTRGGGGRPNFHVKPQLDESGWPNRNKNGEHGPGEYLNGNNDEWRHVSQTSPYAGRVDCKCGDGASIKNAQTYNQNSIIHVLNSTGTPAVPDHPINMFVFALYDEDQKVGDATERSYGIFYPNQIPVYPITFNPSIPC